MTYYDILEISEKASPEVIRMAYKALCKKYHPDVYQGDKNFAEEKMKKINEAYDTLSNETKKRQYDSSLNSQKQYNQRTYYEPKKESYRQPQWESTTAHVNALLKNAFAELERGNWLMADILLEQVLKLDSKKAEAYLGKLMSELHVRTRDGLKNCPHPFNGRNNYQKAYNFGDESLKHFLKETINYINKRNYETECNQIYYKACSLMQTSNSIQGFQDAIAEFEKIRAFKDSAKRISECYKRIAEINSAILAAEEEKERCKEEIEEKIREKLPLIKKIAIFVVPVLIVAIIAVSVLPKIDWNRGNAIDNSSEGLTSNETDSSDISTNVSSDTESAVESTDIVSSQASSQTNSSTSSTTPKNPDASSYPSDVSSSNKPSIPTSSSNVPVFGNYGVDNKAWLTDGDFSYIFVYNSNSQIDVALFGYNGNSKVVNIPSTINGYKITIIGEGVFYDSSVESVTIPNGVTTIENYAFSCCDKLMSITIPDSVKTIGGHAFSGCTSLTSITLPNSITSIGESIIPTYQKLPDIATRTGGTFSGCTSLKSVTIPDSIISMDEYDFYACYALETVYFKSEVQKEKFKECFDSNVQLIVE